VSAAAAGLALALIPAAAAHAATIVSLEHDAVGTSHIGTPNADVALGPTTLHTDLDVDTGDFTGSLPLPGTSTRFELAGFLPVTADVDFVPSAPVTGHIDLSGANAVVTSTAQYYVKLSNIKIVGFPTFTGIFCRTINPVSIPANTPPGSAFDLLQGGQLTGSYAIGNFQNCGLNTWLINSVVPGSNNSMDIVVSNGRVAS